MISSKQFQALQLVYNRRIEIATNELKASLNALNEASALVQKREHEIITLQKEINVIQSMGLSSSIAEMTQRERQVYWLQYDLEEIEFRLNNARESLLEKQVAHEQCSKQYLKAKQRLDFVATQKRNHSRQVIRKQELSDEEMFEDIIMGQFNA